MIMSTANQQIKMLSALMNKPKERKKHNAFVIEGIRMFQEAPKDQLLGVYVSESFLAQKGHQFLLEAYSYEVVADSVFRSVSDTQTPQGILAIVKKPEYTKEDLLKGRKTQLLILESIQDPGNLGTMLRTGEGAGITGIIMNQTTADLFNPKTVRATMGSIFRVPYLITEDLGKILKELKQEGVALYAAHLKGTAAYDAFDYTQACGFLIGNEGNGLSDRIADMADSYVRIPMEGKVESLNAAISATLLMYECNRQRRRAHEDLV